MFSARGDGPLPFPTGASLLVPVLGTAGASGRSTVAGLLAAALAPSARVAVFDAAWPVFSPWSSWVRKQGPGLSTFGHGVHRPAAELHSSASVQVTNGDRWHVLSLAANPSESSPPTPDQWAGYARTGGWPVAIIDTGHSALLDLSDVADPVWSSTAAWMSDQPSTPVLAVPATGQALAGAHAFVTAAERWGTGPRRLNVALVDVSSARPPRQVLVASTLLAGRVGSVTRIPYDPAIQGSGLQFPERISASTQRAARTLARILIDASDLGNACGPASARTNPIDRTRTHAKR